MNINRVPGAFWVAKILWPVNSAQNTSDAPVDGALDAAPRGSVPATPVRQPGKVSRFLF